MATATLSATPRTDRGTGVARKLRQAGQVPAVIYGHGREPQSLALNTRELDRLLSTISAASTVIELSFDGRTARTLIREIQRHPVKRNVLHLDFQELVAGEKVTVSVPLRFTGVADGVRNGGGILEETMHQLHLRLDPTSIPDHIDVDVTPLTIGHSIHVRELTLPEGITVLDDIDATVCVCTAPKAVVETVVAAETEEGAVPAEPELIRKTKPEDEEEAK
ncbi:MAG TPA: 50S ribosomal protein L25/general stress protein Ctc [Gemmatimonadaceae bacterium]|jgi:large subunit ribosomal protein L25|nr:50S ribosomal protein L25/general stress protein Ctc [Gemmatimonadaceae bacterium]